MQEELIVSALQWNLKWCEPGQNRSEAEALMDQHPHTDAYILPEMFTTGFTMEARENAEDMDGPTVNWMRKMADQRNALVCGSLIVKDKGKFFNRMVCVLPEGSLHFYDKRHLFSYAGEHKNYTAGQRLSTFVFKGWKIKPLICYDLRFPVWSRNTDETDLILYVANWPEARCRAWNTLLNARAVENLSYVIGVNRVGRDENGIDYRGDTQIIDCEGRVLANLESNEGVVTVSLSATRLKKFRKRYPFLDDRDAFSLKI